MCSSGNGAHLYDNLIFPVASTSQSLAGAGGAVRKLFGVPTSHGIRETATPEKS